MDITMCSGQDCPLKETCYSFPATPREFRQSYFLTIPYTEETKTCAYEWKRDIKK